MFKVTFGAWMSGIADGIAGRSIEIDADWITFDSEWVAFYKGEPVKTKSPFSDGEGTYVDAPTYQNVPVRLIARADVVMVEKVDA